MTRAEYLRALAELVDRKAITVEQARQLLAMFDAGDIPVELRPLPAALALTPPDAEEDDDRALLLLLLALGMTTGQQRLPRRQRIEVRDRLRTQYMDEISPTVGLVPTNVTAWHSAQMEQIAAYVRRQGYAGAGLVEGGVSDPGTAGRIRQQLAYLYFYAMHVSARILLENPISPAQMVHRFRLYQGAGWGEWFRQDEAGEGGRDGLIHRYDAKDDPSTCNPCSQHNGRYYLPGQGVFPGEICLGGGYCRCERTPIYDLAIYRQLRAGEEVTV